MATLAYTACAATALACAGLLLRAYARTGTRLLLWSGLCFVVLTVNNILLTVDLLVFPSVDLFLLRNLTALAGLSLLLYGLIWESR
ncbi:MAG TPA: DUF5985 family protein [Candidatus Binatia bacterium]|jgi:hypothetical protein